MNGLSLTTKILKGMETSSSLGMFARDTGGCLSAKLAISRSKDEAKEITFAELTESALFYFSAPLLAKSSSKLFAKLYGIDRNLISQPLKNIQETSKNNIKKIKSAKLGQITSVFGLILPIVFAIAPIRNFLTYSNNGKEEFVSVVGLKDNNDKSKHKEAKEKALNLSKKLIGVSLTSLAISSSILLGMKNNKFYNKIEPFITKFVKTFEFTKNNDLKLSHYGAFIYPVSIASYFYASRDKYEKQENVRRFATTVPLLFFGEKVIEKPIYKVFDKIFNTKVAENGTIKTYNEILKLPEKLQSQYLKSKNYAYALTFLINTMAIAFGVGLLNRISTKKRYEREQQQKQNTFVC